MSPSDMLLRIAQKAGYNNLIMIATAHQTLGVNQEINMVDAPLDTGEIGLVKPQAPSRSISPPSQPSSHLSQPSSHLAQATEHQDEKNALIVGGAVIGLAVLWFVTR